MRSASRPARAHALAIPRPQIAVTSEWAIAVIVVALLLAGLLVP
jgi:hypothetical protein